MKKTKRIRREIGELALKLATMPWWKPAPFLRAALCYKVDELFVAFHKDIEKDLPKILNFKFGDVWKPELYEEKPLFNPSHEEAYQNLSEVPRSESGEV